MKAFITGGTGFIGSYLVKILAERGDQLICLTRDLRKVSLPTYNNVEFIEGDILYPETYKKFLVGIDCLFYLAALLTHRILNKEELFKINVKGTEAILTAAKQMKVPKIIFVSSAAIFHPTGEKIVDESSPFPKKFINYYSYTKYLAYLKARELEREGLPIIYILPVSVYGIGSPLFTQFIQYINRRFFITPPLHAKMSVVHVEDVISGILLAEKRGHLGEFYILSGETKAIKEIIDTTFLQLKKKPIIIKLPIMFLRILVFFLDIISYILGKNFYINTELLNWVRGNLVASSDKAQRELGWHYQSFKVLFPQMIKEIIKYK